MTLTVTGGTPPYRAFSSDSAILPVAQTVAGNSVLLLAGSVSVDTLVTVTVQDAALASATSVVTVRAAPLLPALITVVPNGDCTVGAETLCSGGTGVASVVVTGPGGGGIAGRVVRFDVISGAYQLQSKNPATPLAATVNDVTDATGKAAVGLVVNVGAPTQVASIRATDVNSGNQVTGQFLIQQVTTAARSSRSFPPGSSTIDGPSPTECSSGVAVLYHIYGGTPPYQVAATFPGVVSLSGVPVTTNGGSFTATTNGACFVNMQYAISDATGRAIPGGSSPLLTNQFGTGTTAPPTSTTLTVSPATVAGGNCTGKTFSFVVVGGTAPYSVSASPTGPIIAPSPVPTAGTPVLVSGRRERNNDDHLRRFELAEADRLGNDHLHLTLALHALRTAPARRRLCFVVRAEVASTARSAASSTPERTVARPSASSSTKRIAPPADLLVTRHELEPARAGNRRRLDRQPGAREQRGRLAVRRSGASPVTRRESSAASTIPAATASPCSHSP